MSKQTVQNWEGTGGKSTAIPADKLEICARLGIDVQLVLTGIRSKNLDQVAEETGTYKVMQQEKGVGSLSKEEEELIEMYRHVRSEDRTHLKKIIASLASADMKNDKTG